MVPSAILELPNVGAALGVALVGGGFVLLILVVVGLAVANRH